MNWSSKTICITPANHTDREIIVRLARGLESPVHPATLNVFIGPVPVIRLTDNNQVKDVLGALKAIGLNAEVRQFDRVKRATFNSPMETVTFVINVLAGVNWFGPTGGLFMVCVLIMFRWLRVRPRPLATDCEQLFTAIDGIDPADETIHVYEGPKRIPFATLIGISMAIGTSFWFDDVVFSVSFSALALEVLSLEIRSMTAACQLIEFDELEIRYWTNRSIGYVFPNYSISPESVSRHEIDAVSSDVDSMKIHLKVGGMLRIPDLTPKDLTKLTRVFSAWR